MYDELAITLRNNADHYMTVEGAAGLVHLLTDAADAIEKLVEVIQNHDFLESLMKPRWIPVTERLPDYPGRFMCYYEVNDYGEIGHCIDFGRYNPDDGWYVSGVTHWMPLPEPPKEEDDG